MIDSTERIEALAAGHEIGFPQVIQLKAGSRSQWRLDRFDCLCIVALLLTFVVVGQLPFEASKYGDIYFHRESKELARVIRGLDSWHEIRIARAPGPVFYYAIPYSLVPPESPDEAYWRAALIWNILGMSLSILMIRRTGELLGGAFAGKLAVFLSLLLPFAVYYSFGIAAETPAFVATVCFMLGWALWWRARPRRLLSTPCCLGVGGLIGLVLCRPNALVVIGLAGICAVALWRRSARTSPRGRLADVNFAVLCVSATLAAILLVSFSIEHLSDKRGVKLQASNFSDVLFFGSFQFRSEPWDWRFWGKATRGGSTDYQNWQDAHNQLITESAQSGVPISRLEMEWAMRDMIHHPLERLKMFAVRALAMNIWIEHSTPRASGSGLFGRRSALFLFHLLLNAIAMIPVIASGWFLAANRKEFFRYWPLWAPWLGLLLFHSFLYAEPRYILPGLPGETIMAACVIAAALDGRKPLLSGSEQRL